jgi:hypothetical protein
VYDTALGVAAPSVVAETAFAMFARQSWEDSWSGVADSSGLASGGGGCWGVAGRCGIDGDVGGAGGYRGSLVGEAVVGSPLLVVVMVSRLTSPIAEFALKTRVYRSRLWNI